LVESHNGENADQQNASTCEASRRWETARRGRFARKQRLTLNIPGVTGFTFFHLWNHFEGPLHGSKEQMSLRGTIERHSFA